VVPAAMATGPGLAALESVVRVAPGLGLLRDGQKWVALAMPGYVLAAAGIARLGRSAAVIGCVALIAVLPDLARGVGGQLRSVHYPPGWSTVAAMINADPRPVAVLPPDSMREFSWAGDAPVLDPLPRWVSADVLSSGDLLIGGQPVPGEGGRGREATRLLLDGAPQRELADAGIGWVVVQSADVALNLPVAHKDSDITLYEVGGSAPPAAGRPTLIATHLVWVGLLVVGAIGSLMVWRREARRLR
ncbi:MAG: hypothetical protein WBV64_06215, partial [Mycobacterium sp.]